MDCGLTCLAYIVGFIFLTVFLFRLFKKRIFAAFCANLSKGPFLREEKRQLFKPLNDLAKKAGPNNLKVLEIGGGSGSNFAHVETPVQWTVTEPNLCFEPYFIENCAEHRDKHQIGKLVQAYGEDLGQFETESFDAVIITLVLCSVTGVQETLKEIRRVLKPNGVFYFIEHVRAPESDNFRRRFHDIMSNFRIWPGLFDGCYLNRETGQEVEKAGFKKVEIKKCNFNMEPWFFLYQNPVKYAIYGWATK